MKYLFQILNVVMGLALLCVTWSYVKDGDICRTVFGCFAMWSWFKYKEKGE